MTAADVELLTQLDPDQAREFERELRAQHASERRHAARSAPASDEDLEHIEAARAARWTHGSGGGRRAQRAPADD